MSHRFWRVNWLMTISNSRFYGTNTRANGAWSFATCKQRQKRMNNWPNFHSRHCHGCAKKWSKYRWKMMAPSGLTKPQPFRNGWPWADPGPRQQQQKTVSNRINSQARRKKGMAKSKCKLISHNWMTNQRSPSKIWMNEYGNIPSLISLAYC